MPSAGGGSGGGGGPGGGPGGRPSPDQRNGGNRGLQRENRRLRQKLEKNKLAGSDPASRRARIARKQFQRYMDTFKPVEDELVDFTMSGAGKEEALADAREGVASSFETQREQTQRGLSRFGASRTQSERAASRRQSLLREAAARDQATNSARRSVEDRRLSLLAGGLDNSNPRPNPDS